MSSYKTPNPLVQEGLSLIQSCPWLFDDVNIESIATRDADSQSESQEPIRVEIIDGNILLLTYQDGSPADLVDVHFERSLQRLKRGSGDKPRDPVFKAGK